MPTPPVWGGTTAVFIENCTFDGIYHPTEGFYSARTVVRYNNYINDIGATQTSSNSSNAHGPGFVSGCSYGDPAGTDGEPKTGAYRAEVYNNDWDFGSWQMRSGFYAITDNDLPAETNISSNPEPGVYSGRTNCTVAGGCPIVQTGYGTSNDCYQGIVAWVWDNDSDVIDLGTAYECDISTRYFSAAPQAGDLHYSAFSKYRCPHTLTGLDEGCDDEIAGRAGYNTGGGGGGGGHTISTNAPAAAISDSAPPVTIQ